MNMREIAACVAQRHGLTVDDLKLPTRIRSIAHPRQEAMWEMRQVKRDDGSWRYSMPMVAAFFGLKDHTTVFHAVRAYAARRRAESSPAKAVRLLRQDRRVA